MNYELKHIHGIPYFLAGTTVRILDLIGGRPSEQCIAIGTYIADTLQLSSDWEQLVQPHLDAFRASLTSQARDTLRERIVKPQKPRKATRTPRKSANGTKNTVSQ